MIGILLLIACGDDDVTQPDGDRVRVLTRNLYVGTSFDALLAATSPAEIPSIVAQTHAEIQATNYPERAQAIASEIEEADPHLIGLQEVTLTQVQSPGDFALGNPTPATDVELDMLDLLLDVLAARGLEYEAVAISRGLSIELPSATGDDLRLTDREVILARSDVAISDVQEENFAAKLALSPPALGGGSIEFLRGWVAVDATIEGETVRFVSTHLEQQAAEPVQLAQAGELTALLAVETLPVVFVGDFNSAADSSQTATYPTLVAAGYRDAWSEVHPDNPGFTCCQAENLRNPAPDLDQRLDLVLVRGDVDVLDAEIVGEEPGDRTASGLWPSDHAGAFVTLELN